MQVFHVSRERFKVVHKDIADGSEPALRFYIMVAVSTLIAGFGLVSNSTAVVIGAMLVAPLMTPIFGVALALVRGEPALLGRALRAEIIGVLAALAMSYLLGWLLGDFKPTGEMLARTKPNLFDLLVAVLAGFAGAYALIEEKISPALPGVAIATAIVPPLANSGLCMALGEVEGGLGSFLLFFANFLSILLVASVTFVLSGMAKRYGAKTEVKSFSRRFGLPVVAFVAIAAFMGHSLVVMYEERRIQKTIQNTMNHILSGMPSTLLGHIHYYEENGKVQVMASVHTPRFLTPTEVSQMQALISERLNMPSELLVHCVLSNNVSSSGSVKNTIDRSLDGGFIKSGGNRTIAQIAACEQVLREYFSAAHAFELLRVDVLRVGRTKVMLAQVRSIRRMQKEEIALLQQRIRERTKDDSLELVIGNVDQNLLTVRGPLRYGWMVGNKATPSIRKKIDEISAELRAAFKRDKSFELVNEYSTYLDKKLHFLLEVRGASLFPRANLLELQEKLARKFSVQLALHAWSKVEAVQGPDGAESLGGLQRYFQVRQKENLPEEIPFLLEASGR